MLFNSWQFLIFFPVVTGLYFLLPHKFRWFLLLAASCYFYMAFIPVYILILAATIVVDYFAGLLIERSTGKQRTAFLVMSIIANVGFLAFFKYFNFLNDNLAYLAKLLHWNYPISSLMIILPIGLSFHTFQAMSYTIEVYRGNQKAERHFGLYALYVMFYPQLVAGPIERPQNLIHQFYEKHYFDYQRVTDGLKLMAWGLFKKIVIADRLALTVNRVYSNPYDYHGLPLIIATVFFAFQIYCDFSGYSDIAIGAARVMGFRLMTNFNRPYFAKSIAEFWKRWHISLSTWFSDYLYISLGGNRVVKWRWQFNLFITFLVSGLWHGASWTYVVWGGLNGFYLVFSLWTTRQREALIKQLGISKNNRLYKLAQILTTFTLTCFAWIFFRAKSLLDALYIVSNIFTVNMMNSNMFFLGMDDWNLLIAFSLIIFLIFVQLWQRHGSVIQAINGQRFLVRWAAYLMLILAIYFLGMFGQTNFIYFQF